MLSGERSRHKNVSTKKEVSMTIYLLLVDSVSNGLAEKIKLRNDTKISIFNYANVIRFAVKCNATFLLLNEGTQKVTVIVCPLDINRH